MHQGQLFHSGVLDFPVGKGNHVFGIESSIVVLQNIGTEHLLTGVGRLAVQLGDGLSQLLVLGIASGKEGQRSPAVDDGGFL